MRDNDTRKFSITMIWKIACLIFIISIFMIRVFLRSNSSSAETYVRYIYPAITAAWRSSNNIIPFSLSEVFVVLLPLFLLVLLLVSVIKFIKSKSKKEFLRNYVKKFLSAFLAIITFFASTFFLNFGYAYHRESLARNLKYNRKTISVEHLATVTESLVNELNNLADEVTRDINNQFILDQRLEELLKNVHLEYKHLADTSSNEFLKNHLYYGPVRLKPVRLSHYWSYTGTTGMFMPFWMESNVNIDVSPDELIFTALHEIAHSYGFARENEANFLAFLAGRSSASLNIKYSALLNGFVYLSNAIYSENYDVYGSIYSKLNNKVKIDLYRRNVYWKQFQGPVKKISNQANDMYLKSNAQESGIKSYGEVVDLIVAFYDNLEVAK